MIMTVGDFMPIKVSHRINVLKRPAGRRKKNKYEPDYLDIVSAFDIETSTVWIEDHPHSFMYIWQFQLGQEMTIIGRTWEEFDEFLEKLEKMCRHVGIRYNMVRPPVLVCYDHNLAYEFQFLQGIYRFRNEDCFFKDIRKPLYCKLKTVEFRDSLAQSNMSLEKFAEKMKCRIRKQSGQRFNYHIVRYPWTELTPFELEYAVDDVITLEEAIRNEMRQDGDDLYTIPLTSTGYVRRECKKAIAPIRPQIVNMLPDEEQYRLLRRCFRGGNTHANRWHVGKIINDVYSTDIESSYPTQQLTKEFPMSPYHFIEPGDMDRVKRFIELGYSVVGDYQFRNIRLRDKMEPMPYLSFSGCDAVRPTLDNGRILSADYLETSLTEIDLKIVLDQYTADNINVTECMVAMKGMLPQAYRDVIKEYYDRKTSLKKVEGKEYEYAKSKNLLNAVFGMSSQDPIHETITLMPDGSYHVSDYESEISKKNLIKANFPYQWGVYTTALAREELHLGMKRVPRDPVTGISNLLYIDTDSMKTIGKVNLDDLNDELKRAAKKYKATSRDKSGKMHYIGIFDDDGHYDRFITQGAKRYAYENEKGMHVTVSGVTHKEHEYFNEQGEVIRKAEYAAEELGKLENFKPGFIWDKAGGTTIIYNDDDDFLYTDPETGRQVRITRNASIVETTYEMKRTDDYMNLLEMCRLYMIYRKMEE